ncbi:MAG: hypothetical protein HUJ68_03860 [Clostridia bacterium]|nr:hypothetical protein [Clostridia bacterium]
MKYKIKRKRKRKIKKSYIFIIFLTIMLTMSYSYSLLNTTLTVNGLAILKKVPREITYETTSATEKIDNINTSVNSSISGSSQCKTSISQVRNNLEYAQIEPGEKFILEFTIPSDIPDNAKLSSVVVSIVAVNGVSANTGKIALYNGNTQISDTASFSCEVNLTSTTPQTFTLTVIDDVAVGDLANRKLKINIQSTTSSGFNLWGILNVDIKGVQIDSIVYKG